MRASRPKFRIHTSHSTSLFGSVLVVGVFVVVGLVTLRGSNAATYATTAQAESGTLSGNASLVSDANASGSSAVKFGAAVTPPPPPTGGKPDATNTGVPAGTALTIVNGDQTYATDNQVISGLDIRGDVMVTGKNITIKNSIIRGSNNPCRVGTDGNDNTALVWVRADFNASLTFQDSELSPSYPTACVDGMWAVNTTLLRANVHGTADGIKAHDSTTVQDSYIHDLTLFPFDPNQGPDGGDGVHNDAIQSYDGNKHIRIIHNNLAMIADNNSTYQLTQDLGLQSTDIRIENNWLYGGGCTLNLSHKGGPTPMTGIYILNNRFGRNTQFGNCPIVISTQTVLSQNTGNVWDDTGTPIPSPQQHD